MGVEHVRVGVDFVRAGVEGGSVEGTRERGSMGWESENRP